MRKMLTIAIFMMVTAMPILAQISGNVAYSNPNSAARQRSHEPSRISIDGTGLLIEANVLINTTADEYVALLGLSQEGETIIECNQKLDNRIKEFLTNVNNLGIKKEDIFIDFITENRIYDYDISGDIPKEKVVGFEVKKNIAIHYKDKNLLDKIMVVASKANIFDLIKVNYLVKDIAAMHNRLLEEATKIVKEKAQIFSKLYDLKYRANMQIYEVKYDTYFPAQQYDSYKAFEGTNINTNFYSRKYPYIIESRKSTTFFFNPLDNGDFDLTINPVIIEPVVQFTLFLKIKYEIDR